jgi:leucyl/phenylalanyl-tRNA--protein transferase
MPFTVTFDKAFSAVISKCAEAAPDRETTWINDGIEYLYGRLHSMGHAHSVEVWQNKDLVGGLYGVSIGGAFFGESMFSRRTNASKVALIYLVERLNKAGYKLLDTQFITDHLKTMGAVEISRNEYHALLKEALDVQARFHLAPSKEA